MHERILPRVRVGLLFALPLAACLDRNGGQIDPTAVELTGGSDSSGSSTGEATTFPGIMTTTEDGDDSDSDGSGTTEPPAACGNGKIDPPELCDQGENNADDAECTSECRWNLCGDGRPEKGEELCDEGPDNGKYGHCGVDCNSLAERCGDGKVQKDEGELCDSNDPHSGCLKECTWPTSCAELKASWGDQAEDGLYLIRRMSTWLTVWCDTDEDGGGYTFLKYASGVDGDPDPIDFLFVPNYLSALQAEQKCGYWGLRLFSPRTPGHLAAAVQAASAKEFAPIHHDGPQFPPVPDIDSDVGGYLSIMGIYPVTPGTSCVGKPLNSDDCPEWAAKPDPLQPDVPLPFWVTDKVVANEPSTDSCADCSLFYTWDITVDPPVLIDYEASKFGGKGPMSAHFLCEIGDKLGPPR